MCLPLWGFLRGQDKVHSLKRPEFSSVISIKPPNGHGEVSKGMPKTGVFIIPDGKSPGMLETLCLSSVESDNIKGCIDSFMNCINLNFKASGLQDLGALGLIIKNKVRVFQKSLLPGGLIRVF